jgi:Tfp pilus assembly protein PilV
MKNLNYFKKGFSIGEVVLSAFILAFTLVVLLRVLSVGLKDSMDSRDSIIATGLAQEGVELVRNLRDNNWANLGQAGATSFTNFPAADAISCRIDKTAVAPANIVCDSSSKLLNYSSGFYVHGAGTATKFRRQISLDYDIVPIINANTLKVTSMVVWNKSSDTFPAISACSSGNKCVFTEIVLYKWNE